MSNESVVILVVFLMIICWIGFMVTTVIQLEKIRKEQQKITQYIPFDFLEKKTK